MATDYDTTWRVPPDVQRQRDEGALALKMEELAADPTNPALQRDVAFTQAQLSGGKAYGPPVVGGGGMPTPAAAPPRAPAAFQTTTPRIQQLEGQRDALEGRMNQRLDVLSLDRDIAADDLQGALERPMPRRPSLGALPTYTPKEYSLEDALGFSAIATAFMALAGLRARQPLTAAMNSAGQAMQGYTAGRFAQVRQDLDVFRAQFTAGLAANRQMLEEYTSIINDRNTSRAEKMALYQVAATRWNDEATKGMLRLGQYDRAIQSAYTLLNNEDKVRQQAEQFYDGLDNRLKIAGMRGSATGTDILTPEAIDMLAREAIKDKGVLANLGRGVQGAKALHMIMSRMAEILAAQGGPGMADTRARFRADSNSLNKLTMAYDAIVAFEQTAVRNGHILVDLAQKVDQTGVPVAERWLRAGRRAIAGDADVSAFNAQMQVYRAEAARILTNPNLTGQLTDNARHEMETFLAGGESAEQIQAVVALLERDFGNRKKTLEEQIQAARDRMFTGQAAGQASQGGRKTFATEAEAQQALSAGQIRSGDKITIGGRSATVP